jgi:hypothetical protein
LNFYFILAEGNDLAYMEIVSPTSSIPLSLPFYNKSISLIIPLEYYFLLIEYILQYYLYIFPYRLRPLALKSSLNQNTKPLVLNQSTSTSSIDPLIKINSRSVSTQTNFLPPIDLPNTHPTNNDNNENNLHNKRRKFPFNRPILPSSSLLTNLFHQSSIPKLRSGPCSTKSLISLGQCSSVASSSCPVRQQYPYHQNNSSSVFRQIESEMDHVLSDDPRPRASSSSSALLRSINRQEKNSHRLLRYRQQYQSRSAYFLTNPNSYNIRRHQQPLTSTTNTNSSDSSSVFHRFNPRFISQISHQQQQQISHAQRLRDEHIVAANERKALRVLMIIFCVFVTLWTPFFICTFISAICEECRERISPNIWFSITWLGYSSSMANPFIYTIFSDVFRRAFINILFCRSNDSVLSRQISTKFSYQKGAAVHQYIHQQFSNRRSPNHEYSGTSSPIALHQQTPILGDNDATIYINRCVSDSFR